MSGPIQSLADPMSAYNTSMRYFKAEREKKATEKRVREDKKCEKALDEAIKFSSKQLECKCQCKEKQLTSQPTVYRRNLDKKLKEFDRNCREEHEQFMKEIEQDFSCTIL